MIKWTDDGDGSRYEADADPGMFPTVRTKGSTALAQIGGDEGWYVVAPDCAARALYRQLAKVTAERDGLKVRNGRIDGGEVPGARWMTENRERIEALEHLLLGNPSIGEAIKGAHKRIADLEEWRKNSADYVGNVADRLMNLETTEAARRLEALETDNRRLARAVLLLAESGQTADEAVDDAELVRQVDRENQRHDAEALESFEHGADPTD